MVWSKIDTNTCSKEELALEIKRLEDLKNYYMNAEQGIKIFINSIYGACGSPWFAFFNPDIAEAVTLQGQDLIKYSERILDRYFLEYWHKDIALHKKLNLTKVNRVEKSVIIYCDTDSNYICFEEVLSKCDWKKTPKEFILEIYNIFLKPYFDKCYNIYSEKIGTQNHQKFELEKISDAGIWLTKKKYVFNAIWKDPGIDIELFTDITAKGVEIVQSSSSRFARVALKELLIYIFKHKRNFKISEFAVLLKEYRSKFKLSSIEDISSSSSVGNYDKFVLEDKERIVLEKRCPIHVRAAAIYNNKLLNSKYRKKYQTIKSGEKISYYYVISKTKEYNVFGFSPGAYPIEFANSIDYDVQFAKTIIHPINRFIEAMGFSPFSSDIIVANQLF